MEAGDLLGESHASQVRAPCVVFFVLTPIFVLIRFWSRWSRRSGVGLDDLTILISFVCTLTVQILMMLACNHGFGRRINTLSYDDRLMALKLFYVAQIFYKITINLTKVSILLLYLRIFVQRWFRICCYALMILIIAFMIATVGASIWQCDPVEGAWRKDLHPTCIDLTKNWFANAGYSITTDVLILCLPMQLIWASKLPKIQKKALILVFALGGFVTITSIMRATTLSSSTKTLDPTYDIDSTLWTMIEENVAIICACLPACRIILALVFPDAFRSPCPPACGAVGSKGLVFTIGSAPRRLSRSHSDDDDDWQLFAGPHKGEGSNADVAHGEDDASEESLTKPSVAARSLGLCGTPQGSLRYDDLYPAGRAV